MEKDSLRSFASSTCHRLHALLPQGLGYVPFRAKGQAATSIVAGDDAQSAAVQRAKDALSWKVSLLHGK